MFIIHHKETSIDEYGSGKAPLLENREKWGTLVSSFLSCVFAGT